MPLRERISHGAVSCLAQGQSSLVILIVLTYTSLYPRHCSKCSRYTNNVGMPFSEENIMLTFDKIRDMERLEKQSKKLQKAPEDVVAQLREYIKRKERGEKTSSDITELENIKATIKRLFELREGKILSAVLDTVRTGLPPENMSQQEESLFYRMTDELKKYREEFFSELGKEEKTSIPMYHVRKTLPTFVGPDMKTYALKENDVVSIPSPLDELLLKEGVIEKIG